MTIPGCLASLMMGGVTNTAGAVWVTNSATLPVSNTNWLEPILGHGGITVMVGTGGGYVIVSSPTGLATWTQRTKPSDITVIARVAYGAGKYILLGYTLLGGPPWAEYWQSTSTDLVTWTTRASPALASAGAVYFIDGKFIMISSTQYLLSDDGVTWGSPYTAGVVAGLPATNGAGTWISTNTSGYTSVFTGYGTSVSTTLSATHQWGHRAAFGNGKFVRVAIALLSGSGKIQWSTDASSWNSVTAHDFRTFYGVAFGNGIFAAWGSHSGFTYVLTSTDAITWTQVSAAAVLYMDYTNNIFVSGASSTNTVTSS